MTIVCLHCTVSGELAQAADLNRLEPLLSPVVYRRLTILIFLCNRGFIIIFVHFRGTY